MQFEQLSGYVETDSFDRFHLSLFSIYLLKKGGVHEPSPTMEFMALLIS